MASMQQPLPQTPQATTRAMTPYHVSGISSFLELQAPEPGMEPKKRQYPYYEFDTFEAKEPQLMPAVLPSEGFLVKDTFMTMTPATGANYFWRLAQYAFTLLLACIWVCAAILFCYHWHGTLTREDNFMILTGFFLWIRPFAVLPKWTGQTM